MKFSRSPIALAALAVCGALPLAVQAAPSVSWAAPLNGATLKGTLSGSACAANTSGATRVTFWATNWQINNDYSPPFNCSFDTTRLADGNYTLRAVAYDASGASSESRINVTIANKTATSTSTANAAPSVSITSPASGATVSGSALAYAANAADDAGVARVEFSLDGNALLSDTSSPYGGTLDTTKLANGTHVLRAVAYDAQGLSATSQVSINVQNSTSSTSTSTTTTTTTTTAATATPAPGSGSLDVWFKAPFNGATISGTRSGSGCYVNGTGVSRVAFFLDNTALNSDTTMSDGMQCVLDTTRFANGSHQLKAQAFDASGNSRWDVIGVNIQNSTSTSSTSTTTTPTNAAPSVSLASPASGQTVSGTAVAYSAIAADDAGVARVDFFVDSSSLGSKTAAPYGGTFDSTRLANGTHVLRAVAYDAQGLSASSQVSINVQNSTPSTTTTSTTAAPGSGSLDVWFKAPLNGATISGTRSGTGCYVYGSGVTRVAYYLDNTALNTDTTMSDGMQCVLDTTRFANGSHQLKAQAFDSSGNSRWDVIGVNIQNSISTASTSTTSTSTSTTSTTTTPTNAAPTVSITSPASGATVAGSAVAYAANAADDAGVSRVDFFVDSTALVSDTSSPYGGALDTTKLANGTHVLKAVAYDAQGLSATSQISINVQNAATSTSTSGSGSAISSADILIQAQANVPFAQQSGYGGQVLGQYPAAKDIPETGINGFTLPNGETLRLGKQADPMNTSRNAFAFQLAPNDTLTSGSRRSEFEFTPNIELGKTYWIAYSLYIYDWGTLTSGDDSLFGTQVHNGNSNLGLSPSFTIYTSGAKGGRTLQIYRQYSTSTSPTQSNSVIYRSPEYPIAFGRWVDFVFKFREAIDGSGLLQVWMDGTQLMDYQGPLGFYTPGYRDYAKFGYYNWGSFNTSRKVLVRSPVLVSDPTGSKYQATDLRSFVQQNQ